VTEAPGFDPRREWPTDLHVHIQPWETMHPKARETIERGRGDYDLIKRCMADPAALVDWMNEARLGRVAIINYVAPEIMGFGPEVNEWSARYRDACGGRVIAFGGVHPPATRDVEGEMSRLLDELRLDGIKIHPPHQALSPDAYATGACPELRFVYEACEERGVPIMFHTGTSVFPGARSRLGSALVLDDVAIDFPRLKMILAHAGRPLWTEEAFFLARRHPNVHLDLSGIPPASLPQVLPRLDEIADKCLWGTDWPSPGVKSARGNLDAFFALPFREETKRKIAFDNALKMFPLAGAAW
jgi:predicted TIM-barrel fold metal-dependent hydrolase